MGILDKTDANLLSLPPAAVSPAPRACPPKRTPSS